MLMIVFFTLISSLVCAVPFLEENVENSSEVNFFASYFTQNYVAKDHSKAEIRDGRGQYGLSYITSNGIEISERGYLKTGENGTYYFVKEGSHQYPDVNGTKKLKFDL